MKCIAIGNRIMGDDSIGIRVLEEIKEELLNEDIDVIIAETDIDYALSKVVDGDFIIILDSCFLNKTPGTITLSPIKNKKKEIYSAHDSNLINFLDTYKKSIKGYIIGIEIGFVDFSLNLSKELEDKFNNICEEVSSLILRIKGE